ncbi:hypothetical protein F7725_019638, partial [Dissostichus mawsoni]
AHRACHCCTSHTACHQYHRQTYALPFPWPHCTCQSANPAIAGPSSMPLLPAIQATPSVDVSVPPTLECIPSSWARSTLYKRKGMDEPSGTLFPGPILPASQPTPAIAGPSSMPLLPAIQATPSAHRACHCCTSHTAPHQYHRQTYALPFPSLFPGPIVPASQPTQPLLAPPQCPYCLPFRQPRLLMPIVPAIAARPILPATSTIARPMPSLFPGPIVPASQPTQPLLAPPQCPYCLPFRQPRLLMCLSPTLECILILGKVHAIQAQGDGRALGSRAITELRKRKTLDKSQTQPWGILSIHFSQAPSCLPVSQPQPLLAPPQCPYCLPFRQPLLTIARPMPSLFPGPIVPASQPTQPLLAPPQCPYCLPFRQPRPSCLPLLHVPYCLPPVPSPDLCPPFSLAPLYLPVSQPSHCWPPSMPLLPAIQATPSVDVSVPPTLECIPSSWARSTLYKRKGMDEPSGTLFPGPSCLPVSQPQPLLAPPQCPYCLPFRQPLLNPGDCWPLHKAHRACHCCTSHTACHQYHRQTYALPFPWPHCACQSANPAIAGPSSMPLLPAIQATPSVD